ncbi:MAG: cytochrome c biogenesis protein CcsA [Saprospiraceae bacterium]|nr:MAG: cytochrome C assembly protein [Bacteroidetes bacterium OLB9]MCO6462694.1 cytochrome c biogenesis protein CcsA [Saprospiraceae bacterium]MCZ2337793.1 cytochrome c biogenesis protein CcsA [Chitinophagales bacterium]
MKRFAKIFFSTRTMAVLLVIYGAAMAVATFVENDFDTPTAKALIYNATWFELLMFWLIALFAWNIKVYNLTRREKWPVLAFHLAFILMFIGGAITRYVSFEGQMPIKEGKTTNEIISDNTYFKLSINDGDHQRVYDRKPYMMSYFNAKATPWPLKRTFKQDYQFGDKIVTLRSLDYIPLAKDSVRVTPNGVKMLKIITMGTNGRVVNYITDGEIKSIDNTLFSLNNPVEGAIALVERDNDIALVVPEEGTFMSMEGQQIGMVTDTALFNRQSGVIHAHNPQSLNHRALYSIGNVSFIIPEASFIGEMVYYSGDKTNEKDKNLLSIVQLEVSSGNERDTVFVKGGKSVVDYTEHLEINGLNIGLGFGSKIIKTDFSLRCDDFILERYPGSNNPSSYESLISVIDGGQEEQHRIFMNNVMDYKGYRFFQSSYFPDESGTILSVNADRWGTNITYIGYFLLFIGMFFTLFWKGTRFWNLNKELKRMHMKNLILPIIICIGMWAIPNTAQSQDTTSVVHNHADIPHVDMPRVNPTLQFARPEELGDNSNVDIDHANKFGYLQVQDFQGRIKPMNTHVLELLRKIYKKDKYQNGDKKFTAEQWFLTMQVNPGFWANEPLIKVSSKGGDELKNLTGANDEGYTSYANLFDQTTGNYILEQQANESFSKRKADQSNFDKEVIEVTERFNIFSNVAYGYYMRVVPVQNDPAHTWRSWIYSDENNELEMDTAAFVVLTDYFDAIKTGMKTGDWSVADKSLNAVNAYQQKWGSAVTISPTKEKLEVLYNRFNAFFWLMIIYSLLGVALVALGFAEVFSIGTRYSRAIRTLTKVLLGIMMLALIIQAIALGVRWYLSGHAPWSNGYEAIVFISGIGVLSGLVLYKNRNAFIPAAGALVAMIMMGFAHGGSMLDPQITPLEPVLKSYWLMVHVGIITSSYGFFGLSAVLSVISLILFSVHQTPKIKQSIKEMTIVNEMALTIGIFALAAGTFLGGMWANESWGRYWSWDPKETWAFISVIFYAVVLHLRLIPKAKGTLVFNIASLWAIWSIIFTYFGVNYYLSGLHSYAAGDPMPVPAWIYITAAGMLLLTGLAIFKGRQRNTVKSITEDVLTVSE